MINVVYNLRSCCNGGLGIIYVVYIHKFVSHLLSERDQIIKTQPPRDYSPPAQVDHQADFYDPSSDIGRVVMHGSIKT